MDGHGVDRIIKIKATTEPNKLNEADVKYNYV